MENERNEVMEIETNELTESNNYETENSKSGSGLLVAGGLALIGAAGAGAVAMLRKKGLLPTKEERAIKRLEKAGYVVMAPEKDFVDVEPNDVEDVAPEEEETKSKKGTKKNEK